MDITNSIEVSPKQSLQQMLYIKNIILSNIQDNDGEVLPDEEGKLMSLELNIPVKVDAWAWLLMNNGGLDKEIDLLTERKKATDESIQHIKSTKERLKARANEILRRNNMDSIKGNYFHLKRATGKSSRVIMSKVEDEFKSFELPKLSFIEYSDLLAALELYDEQKDTQCLLAKIKDEKLESCGVKSLPVGHIAIETREEPTIRIYKN